jgi:hypothetical protein
VLRGYDPILDRFEQRDDERTCPAHSDHLITEVCVGGGSRTSSISPLLQMDMDANGYVDGYAEAEGEVEVGVEGDNEAQQYNVLGHVQLETYLPSF